MYQQGEVMLVPVSKVPKGKSTKSKSYIVAHSETGHHHVLESATEFEITEQDVETYLTVLAEGKLVHKKAQDRHKDLVIKPGKYMVHHKTEYNPFDRLIQRVVD